METWPETVPYEPLARSFQADPFRAPNATEMDDGPFRTRPRSTLRVATLRFTIRMSNAELAIFAAWVASDLVQGTLPFSMNVWRRGGYSEKTCRFREPYREDPGHGLRYRVGLVLDVEDY